MRTELGSIIRTLAFHIKAREDAPDINNEHGFNNLRKADGALADFVVDHKDIILKALRELNDKTTS